MSLEDCLIVVNKCTPMLLCEFVNAAFQRDIGVCDLNDAGYSKWNCFRKSRGEPKMNTLYLIPDRTNFDNSRGLLIR